MNLTDLAKPFPKEAVSWRAQSLNQAKDKALALAYIDARDVMNRLDEVCGPENWSDSYTETPKGRIIATIAIKIGGEWVSKSDGAGETDVEGDKGAISDALKRAAVKWGIGRYLYELESPWVPCELGNNGKWRKWTADPWSCIRNAPRAPQADAPAAKLATITQGQCDELMELAKIAKVQPGVIAESYNVNRLADIPATAFDGVKRRLNDTIDSNTAAHDRRAGNGR